MEEAVKLDRKSFEALAGETRVKALKSLLRRRKTLTELSRELGLSPSTMKEHLDVLCSAELVVQVDEGRKWKYYELTRKGRSIVEPHELRVWIILGLSIIAAGAAMLNLFAALQAPMGVEGKLYSGAAQENEAYAASEGADFAVERVEAAGTEKSVETPSGDMPFMQVGMAAAAVLILAWAIFYARGEGVI